MERIKTTAAPLSAGHYSQAVVHGGFAFVSGQLPLGSGGHHRPGEVFTDQARQCLENLLQIVRAAGGSPESLVKVTAYIVGIDHWPEFNRVFALVIGDCLPARTVVPVSELHHGYLVEVDAIAAVV